jgi:isoleucyl-tRNA synthetase
MPEPDAACRDLELEERMARAEKIVMLVRAMRMKSNLKVRQPLRRIILPIADEHERESVRRMEEVILEEINVKRIEYVTDESGIVTKKARPNFKAIGPKFGKAAQQVAQRVRELSPAEVNRLERTGTLTLSVGGSDVSLLLADVEIVREDIHGWLVESDGGLTVALDTTLDETLITEGVAREFVNRIQNMRKDAGFEVTDRIRIRYSAAGEVARRLASMVPYVCAETLAESMEAGMAPGEYKATLDLNGDTVEASIERLVRG